MAKKKNKGQQKGRDKTQKKFSEKEYLRTRMRALPIGKCYIAPDIPGTSEVTVFVTRMHPAGTVSIGMFLIDKYCCGVKNAFCRFSLDPSEMQDILHDYDNKLGIKEIPYEEAHNLVYGAVDYAESIGIPPHKDFDDSRYILAEDDDNVPLIEYEFGQNGRPTLICHSAVEIDYYRKMMLKKLNPDEFDVILLGGPSKRDDRDDEEDDYEDEEDSDEDVSYWTDGVNQYPAESIEHMYKDLSADIKMLDDVRKTAYVILMTALAKDMPEARFETEPFVTTAEQAVSHYRKYGEAAYGAVVERLVGIAKAVAETIASSEITKMDERQSNSLFCFSMGYTHAVRQVNLLQADMLNKVVDDKTSGADRMLEFLHIWIDSHLSEIRYRVAVETRREEIPERDFNVAGLRPIEGKWAGQTIRTRVKPMKVMFVSKDPVNYYKRKVREVVDTPFAKDEDFIGLIYTFNNQTHCSCRLVIDGEADQAFHLLRNIVSETLWSMCSHRFDQWIDDADTRSAFSVMLSNAVTCLSNIVWRNLVERHQLPDVYRDAMRLRIALMGEYSDIVDLHPLIYSIESVILNFD